jgi:class 3 adenylate cyclase
MSASPGVAIAHHQAAAATDARALLPAIRAPALVLYRTGDAAADPEEIRTLARDVPRATLVELPGVDHLPFVGDTGALLDRVREFLAGPVREAPVAGDTSVVSAVVSLHPRGEVDEAVRLLCEREIARFRGVELDGPGPGRAAAMFDGPMRAVRFARAVLARVRFAGVELGAGVCFDECQLGETEVDGAAVRLAPALAARAQPGEVLVTGTVRALLQSSGLGFAARGVWGAEVELYAVLPDAG